MIYLCFTTAIRYISQLGGPQRWQKERLRRLLEISLCLLAAWSSDWPRVKGANEKAVLDVTRLLYAETDIEFGLPSYIHSKEAFLEWQ